MPVLVGTYYAMNGSTTSRDWIVYPQMSAFIPGTTCSFNYSVTQEGKWKSMKIYCSRDECSKYMARKRGELKHTSSRSTYSRQELLYTTKGRENALE